MSAKENKLERQRRLKEIYTPDKSSRCLAEILGCSPRTVCTDLRELGIREIGEFPKRVDVDFFKGWSRNNAYVFGYFCGDGSIIKQGKYSRMVLTSKDKDILEKMRLAMGGKQTIQEHKIPGHMLCGRYVKETIAYNYVVSDSRFMVNLIDKGAQVDKTNNGLKFYPEVPFEYQDYLILMVL